MPTTTIRLTDELKDRVAAAAKRSGVTPHAFIIEAIAQKTEQADLNAEFDAVAERRYANIISSGTSISWDEMRSYLQDHAAGKPAKRPAARKLVR